MASASVLKRYFEFGDISWANFGFNGILSALTAAVEVRPCLIEFKFQILSSNYVSVSYLFRGFCVELNGLIRIHVQRAGVSVSLSLLLCFFVGLVSKLAIVSLLEISRLSRNGWLARGTRPTSKLDSYFYSHFYTNLRVSFSLKPRRPRLRLSYVDVLHSAN